MPPLWSLFLTIVLSTVLLMVVPQRYAGNPQGFPFTLIGRQASYPVLDDKVHEARQSSVIPRGHQERRITPLISYIADRVANMTKCR